MTRVYCGWCGSASGVSARYCRSCGGEIAAQSGPLSAIPRTGPGSPRTLRQRSTQPSSPTSPLPDTTRPASEGVDEGAGRELVVQEEQAVQTLKRLRTSGPLLIEEAMNRRGQVPGLSDPAGKGERIESESDTSEGIASVSAVGQATVDGDWGREDGVGRTGGRTGMGGRDGDGEPVTGPGNDRATEPKGGPPHPPEEVEVIAGDSPAPLPAQSGPSRVLADASGLQSGLQLSPGVRIGLIATIILISTVGYLLFRDKLMATAEIGADVRELRSPLELSEELLSIGERAVAAGDLAAAVAAYSRARQLTPSSPKVLFQLGDTYQRQARIDEALTTYGELLRVAPENLEARLRIARIYQSRNVWAEAHREFQRIIALDQNSPQSSQALEEIENYEAKLAGQAAPPRTNRRRSQRLNLTVLPPATRTGPGEISLLPPGITVSDEMRPPASLDGGQSSEQPDPEALVASRRELGLRYLNIKEYRAAIKEFLIVLRLTPKDKDICYFLASAYNGLGMYPEAHDYYKRVDSGRYVQVSQSGAKRTEKAAADQRRQMNQ